MDAVICAWLDEVIDPVLASAPTPPSAHRRRRRAGRCLRTPYRRRPPPPPRAMNNADDRTPKPRRSKRNAAPPTPTRLPRSQSASAANVLADAPALIALPHRPGFSGPATGYARTLDALESSRPQRSREASSADSHGSHKRSSSPAKGLADLVFTDKGFRYTALEDLDDASILGGDILELHADLSALEDFAGVVPAAVRPRVEDLLRGKLVSRPRDVNYAAHSSRSTSELEHELIDVEKVVRKSRQYKSGQFTEPAWNEDVHGKLLEIALDCFPDLERHNITTAQISPKDLVLRNNFGGLVEGKMVDYAICLTSPQLEEKVVSALKGESSVANLSINPSFYAPLRTSPIAISIETKTHDHGGNMAMAQLAVWAGAHLERLRRFLQLHDSPMGLPTLPLVHVSGDQWWLYYVKMDFDTGATKMFGCYYLGDTKSLLDVYKLLCAIRVLAKWAGSAYRSWWDQCLSSS